MYTILISQMITSYTYILNWLTTLFVESAVFHWLNKLNINMFCIFRLTLGLNILNSVNCKNIYKELVCRPLDQCFSVLHTPELQYWHSATAVIVPQFCTRLLQRKVSGSCVEHKHNVQENISLNNWSPLHHILSQTVWAQARKVLISNVLCAAQ